MVRIDRLGEAGVGKVLVLDAEAAKEVVGKLVLGAGAGPKAEIKVLAEASAGGIGIGKVEANAALNVGNQLPAGLDEVVTRAGEETLVMMLGPWTITL